MTVMKHSPRGEEETPTREEVRRRRKKKARRLMLRRLCGLVAVIAVIAALWKYWDVLAPDKLWARFQDSMNDTAATYPVDIAGTNVKSIIRVQSYTATLSDSYLTYYNSTGGELTRYACTYATALMRTAGKYVLLAEQGGKRLQLLTRSMMLANLTTEQDIVCAAVNAKGQFLVLTQGTQGYAAKLTLYDRKGREMYTRTRNYMATDVALSSDGTRFALLSVSANNGTLDTVVEEFSFSTTDTDALVSYTATDALLYRLEFLQGNRLVAVGDNGALFFEDKNTEPVAYTIEGKKMLGYAAANNSVALVLRNYGETGDGQVVLLNVHGEERTTVDFTGDFRHISTDGQKYLLLTDGYVQSVSAGGGGEAMPAAADGQQAALSGNTAIVLGLSTLQAYSLN